MMIANETFPAVDTVALQLPTTTPTSSTARRRARFAAVAFATLAANAEWLIAHALGANFTVSSGGSSLVLTPVTVTIVSVWFGVMGWAALAVLERYSRRASTIWTRLAVGALVLSFVPVFADHATAGTHVALVTIHATVAVILVRLMRRTARDR